MKIEFKHKETGEKYKKPKYEEGDEIVIVERESFVFGRKFKEPRVYTGIITGRYYKNCSVSGGYWMYNLDNCKYSSVNEGSIEATFKEFFK